MLVSWKWLSRYLDLPMKHEDLALRLSLSGLNHEETTVVDGDVVIDLEVTSNRGDCLGHLGVAREIGVLYDLPVKTPEIELPESGMDVASLLSVENHFLDACPRYTARVIQGIEVGPSPAWMADSLRSIGIGVVNNVVDATNYVMMECGQPLHAFDYSKLAGKKVVVRPATPGETIEAIDHRSYALDESMCVIADAAQANAVAGVMGGAVSEVEESTTDLVIEAAIFTPLSVRRTARKLKLHSPSSYRFERRVDPVGVDWASRRVCQLILESGGGKLASGVIDTAAAILPRPSVVLRLSELERILGIQVERSEVERILVSLGCESKAGTDRYVPPSWRHDLTREADLIEEVARIHGYDKIPEDAPIPVAPSSKREFDVAMEGVRSVMITAGISEAMTPSLVTQSLDALVSPWTDRPPLRTETPMLKGARCLRRSLIPSLLEGRGNNWALASIHADLFEIAHVYLPGKTADSLPDEHYSLGLVSGRDYLEVKGVIETLCRRMGVADSVRVEAVERSGMAKGATVAVHCGTRQLGYLGIVDSKVLKTWKLAGPVVAAELSLVTLLELAHLVPQQQSVSVFPSVQRDLNFIVAESVRWSELEQVVRSAVGKELAAVDYRETYRDPKKDGANRKRILLSVELQRHDGTLSGDQADELIQQVIGACGKKLSAELLS
ncbi:phenylalanine--tRNA ligase subunit beta [Novipirellula artificiosorum]|uniref:Phenylalanine--tRNA ligase beta subunit n=1 Tax=Novipirellula artificiosorum TaxID=2528016 RepID=A0A5C6DTG8_9BACT|nr:phenylalanine--tRNA ligase subunit beta [Novipirellula artificiosorum]TWU40613.1 Phenylalanine--tRNA ligase beta subunit [Novipirellula artificiosorum]